MLWRYLLNKWFFLQSHVRETERETDNVRERDEKKVNCKLGTQKWSKTYSRDLTIRQQHFSCDLPRFVSSREPQRQWLSTRLWILTMGWKELGKEDDEQKTNVFATQRNDASTRVLGLEWLRFQRMYVFRGPLQSLHSLAGTLPRRNRGVSLF